MNRQLEASTVSFYAIDAGNDLGGLFLAQEERDAAVRALPRESDWPYIPTMAHPWYGQPQAQDER